MCVYVCMYLINSYCFTFFLLSAVLVINILLLFYFAMAANQSSNHNHNRKHQTLNHLTIYNKLNYYCAFALNSVELTHTYTKAAT